MKENREREETTRGGRRKREEKEKKKSVLTRTRGGMYMSVSLFGHFLVKKQSRTLAFPLCVLFEPFHHPQWFHDFLFLVVVPCTLSDFKHHSISKRGVA